MRAILLSEFWAALVLRRVPRLAERLRPRRRLRGAGVHFLNTDSAVAGYSYALIPDRLLGRAMSASNTLRVVVTPLGPLAAGLLLSSVSPRVSIAALASVDARRRGRRDGQPSIREAPRLDDLTRPAASPAEAG